MSHGMVDRPFQFPVSREPVPAVMQVRYGLRPFSDDRVTVHGTLRIEISPVARILSPFLRLGGAFAPYAGENVPVTVRMYTGDRSAVLHFDRLFHYAGRRAARFHSRISSDAEGHVFEQIRFGLAWKALCVLRGPRLVLRHAGYAVQLGGRFRRLPLEWLLGRCTAVEEALGADTYRMSMSLEHPVLGVLQRYGGTFHVTEVVHA